MRVLTPENGLVIRYDFLWKDEFHRGLDLGRKDRPCAVVLVSKPHFDTSRADTGREVVVCPITHTPPEDRESAIEIPPKVAAHLNLDAKRSWIRTHEVNSFTWEDGHIPFGLVPASKGNWSFGILPPSLYAQMLAKVKEAAKQKNITVIQRDLDDGS